MTTLLLLHVSDLGYAGQVFAYVIDFAARSHHEGNADPPAREPHHPAPQQHGRCVSRYEERGTHGVPGGGDGTPALGQPGRLGGNGLAAEVFLHPAPEHESLVITIPIGKKRFYYNRKINCLPAEGARIETGGQRQEVRPTCTWAISIGAAACGSTARFGCGASASGFLPDGRRIGLNLGFGFGDTSAAENAAILEGRIHKLEQCTSRMIRTTSVPWHMVAPDGRLDLTFTLLRPYRRDESARHHQRGAPDVRTATAAPQSPMTARR